MQTIRYAVAHSLIVKNTDNCCAAGFCFFNQCDDGGAIFGVQRGGGFIEQQNRVIDDKPAGDVDALLFATGEGRRRQVSQPLRHVQAGKQVSRFGCTLLTGDTQIQQRLHHHIQRGNPRDYAQELAHPADG